MNINESGATEQFKMENNFCWDTARLNKEDQHNEMQKMLKQLKAQLQQK